MSWLQKFEKDIVALAQIHQGWFGADLEEFMEEIKDVFAPLLDGTLDSGDLQAVADQWWNKFSSMEIEAAKKEVEIHRRLADLYEYLASATDEEWEAYTRVVVNARFSGQNQLLRMIIER